MSCSGKEKAFFFFFFFFFKQYSTEITEQGLSPAACLLAGCPSAVFIPIELRVAHIGFTTPEVQFTKMLGR